MMRPGFLTLARGPPRARARHISASGKAGEKAFGGGGHLAPPIPSSPSQSAKGA